MDPPQCVQNAMMTKDKKPFTYTPGGIDLSEVRSPRMQRRIERNANLAGAGDIPKPQPPPPQNLGALPPSVQAAMRPQPQVQVFPSGPPPPPPMSRGGAPPPPPPFNAPPPPPPPTGPLPTQKVTTSDNQVLERPDMTKIIPDNPMALLRKTGGPAPRRSIVDEMFAQGGKAAPAPVSPPSAGQHRPQPQFEQQQQRYQPPVIERGAPISPVPQQQHQPPPPQQYQPSRQQYQPPPPQQRSPEAAPEPPRYQPPIIERQPTIPRQNNVQPDVKTSSAHLGSLYIPPANQQPAQQQRRVVSPPSPPERSTDSPNLQTPPLREAPRPWQAKKAQEEIPPWAKRNEQERPEPQIAQQTQSPPAQQQQQPQQRWAPQRPVQQQQPAQQQQYNQQPQQYNQQQPQYSPQPQYNQQPQQLQQPAGVPVRIIIRTNTGPAPYQEPDAKTEAVYVTQPVVLQHPGPRAPSKQQQQQNSAPYKVDSQGARAIPVAVDGNNLGSQSPATPGANRSLNRQQSWSNNPSQSNSFKIIQKITQTDDDEEDEDAPVTEHAPRYPQNFQQQPPGDQLRRMKLNETDQNLMNKFKQVPSGPQPQRKGPQVRTIPVQIEGDEPSQPYVHPSEQVVPEPKKYTGSSIPSRSFKILQAMTAPDNCANADEQYEATPYDQWGYDPNYPPYPPSPYWHDYYQYYYQESPQVGLSKEESADPRATPRQTPTPRGHTPTPRGHTPTPRGHTPVPFWNYMPPYPYPPQRRASTTEGESDAETCTNPRSTPLPYWGEEPQAYPQYPAYYDPYYYSYYYGYPPMYPPYPYYGPNSDTDDFAGYSSTDEMAYYNNCQKGRRRSNSFSGLRATTPKIVVTPTLNVRETVVSRMSEVERSEAEPEEEINTSESDSDTETEDDYKRNQANSPLKSIRSVSNVHMYADEDEESRCSEDEVGIEEYNEDGNEDIDEENSVYIVDDDSYPHQLSVIYEESERTDSRMRSASALSDSTTIAERSDDEDLSPNVVCANKPFKFCVSVTEEEKEAVKAVVSVADGEIKTFDESPTVTVEEPIEEIQEETHAGYEEEEEGKESDESEDWWGIIGKEDDLPAPKPVILKKKYEEVSVTGSKESICEKDKLNVDSKKESANIKTVTNEPINTSSKSESNGNKKPKEPVKQKNNYARAKSVYDKIEDEFEEEENSGTLIEMESFVAQLERIQRASGLWNIQLPRKVSDNKPTNKRQDTANKDKVSNVQSNSEKNTIQTKTENDRPNKTKPDIQNIDSRSEDSDVDFWSTIKSEEDEVRPRSKKVSNHDSSASYNNYNCSESSSEAAPLHQDIKTEESEEDSYENIPVSSKSSDESYANKEIVESADSSEEELDSSEDESEDHDQKDNDLNNNEEKEEKPMTIQERIQALKETIRQKQSKLQQQEQEIKNSVKDKISAIETTSQNRSKTTSTKSSVKSFEEYSEEEEGDSGVTSDMSRHISDTEEFPELKKLTRYQRAATHSRLFKLLQDECENEEDEEEEEEVEEKTVNSTGGEKSNNPSVRKNTAPSNTEPPRRDKLSLPLNTNETESLCSSGVTSPGSPVNEKLVNELVQSLLKRKKGQIFRNMPKEKLFAAAARILQEDLEGLEASSEDCSSFLSPLRGSTGSSTAAQTPQEFNGNYDEYKQYYESWSEAERLYDENYDILPSKAFKLLQEHSNLSKTGTIAGLLAKCPRVLSSKNIHRKLMKLLESPDDSSSPLPNSENPLESNEVTSAS